MHVLRRGGLLLFCGGMLGCGGVHVARCTVDGDCPKGQRCVHQLCAFEEAEKEKEKEKEKQPENACAAAGITCAPWEVCVQAGAMGACADAGYQLRWVSPDARGAFHTAQLPGRLEVQRAGGDMVPLTTVPVSGAEDGGFTGSMGTYSGTLQLGEEEGEKEFIAGWDEGPTAQLTLTLDKTPPEVAVQVEARPETFEEGEVGYEAYWKKDEAAAVRVTVTGGPMPEATHLTTAWGAEVREGQCTGACMGNCRCFAVPLDGAPLMGFRGEARFSVEGVMDAAGNVAAPVDAGIQLTRFKWQRTMQLASRTTPLLAAPALTETGLVLWGVQTASGSTPRLEATQPDGGKAWEAITEGTVTAGPVVGASHVWVSTAHGRNFSDIMLQGINPTEGTPVLRRCRTTQGSTPLGGVLAFAPLSLGARGTLHALIWGHDGKLEVLVAGTCTNHASWGGSATPALLVVQGLGESAAVFVKEGASTARTLWKEVLSVNTEGARRWTSKGSAVLPTSNPPLGLFFDGMGRVGGGGSGRLGGGGQLFSVEAGADLGNNNAFSVAVAVDGGAPVVGHNFVLWGDAQGALHKLSYVSGQFGERTRVETTAGSFRRQGAMPLLGAGGRVYVVSASGQLHVHSSVDMREEWHALLAPLTGTEAAGKNVSELALDVYRKADGAKDCARKVGVLYVVTRSRRAVTLHALLVDSPGLDGNAPWPKYQRDNANRGNVTLPLTPWTCP